MFGLCLVRHESQLLAGPSPYGDHCRGAAWFKALTPTPQHPREPQESSCHPCHGISASHRSWKKQRPTPGLLNLSQGSRKATLSGMAGRLGGKIQGLVNNVA